MPRMTEEQYRIYLAEQDAAERRNQANGVSEQAKEREGNLHDIILAHCRESRSSNTTSTTATAVMARGGTTMSNNAFTEEYRSQQPDPTAPDQTVDFHYDEVDRNLAGNPTMDDEDAYREKLTMAMSTLFDWIISDMRPHLIGRRVIAAAWVVNPKRFGNASLRKLAKDLGCSIAHLSEMTAEFSRAFAISNRYQSHNWRKKT